MKNSLTRSASEGARNDTSRSRFGLVFVWLCPGLVIGYFLNRLIRELDGAGHNR
jgi:hypothetical protein